jgi:hypothetical protein
MWTLTSCASLGAPLSAGQTELTLTTGAYYTALCDLIAGLPARHVILEVYSSAGAETIAAYGCKAGKVQIVRGLAGTTARDWGATGCLRTLQIITGALCTPDEDPTCPPLPSPWTQVQVCNEISLDLVDPTAPRLCLRPTGVVPGDYCGMKINAFGQITSIPQSFPASCIPIFDPCCGDTGAGGGSITLPFASTNVSYAPTAPPHYLSAGPLSAVLGTVDSALFSIQGQITASAGVQSLSGVGGQITVTGPASTPALGLTPTAIAPGTYNGITFDTFGRATGAVPTASAISQLTFNASGTLSVSVAGSVVTYGLANATQTTYGAVQYVDVAQITNNTVPPGETLNALSYAGGQSLVAQLAKTVTAGVGLSGGGSTNANMTLNLNFPGLSAATFDAATDELAFYDAGIGTHAKTSGLQFAANMNLPIASLLQQGATTVAQRGVDTVTGGPTVFTVTLLPAMPSTSYHVSVAPEGTPVSYAVSRISPSVFTVTFSAAPTAFSLTVSTVG